MICIYGAVAVHTRGAGKGVWVILEGAREWHQGQIVEVGDACVVGTLEVGRRSARTTEDRIRQPVTEW